MSATDPIPRSLEFTDLDAVHARTPARILVGRAGPAYRTVTQLELRCDHAAAVDAVHAELDLFRDLGPELIEELLLFLTQSRAASRAEYLGRPDLGRKLSEESRQRVQSHCPVGCDLQIVIGDGLSAAAIAAQVPRLLPGLVQGAQRLGWGLGRPFAVRYCRVGVMNDIGELLDPEIVVLLIGERPGLATAESLSAYLAYRPRPGDTDARRNLISNIHCRGVLVEDAIRRILALAGKMRQERCSGMAIKEELSATSPLDRRIGVEDHERS